MAAISAIVIARNEEANLSDCLATVAWADERLVIDAFSTDGTTQGLPPDVRLIERNWTDFPDQRNAGLRLAVHDWVVFIDADERVPPSLGQEIRTRVGREAFTGYWVPRRNRIFGRWMRGAGWWPDYQLRIMNRQHAAYVSDRSIHELVDVSGTVGRMKHHLEHWSYTSVAQFRARQRLYAEAVADDYYRSGTRRRPTAIALQPLREFWRRLISLRGYQDRGAGVLLATLMAEHEWRVQRALRARWKASSGGRST